MLAARCVEYGTPLVISEVPAPEPGKDDVLIAVRAAAVNFPDILVASNRYQVSVPVPFTSGSELAGTVLAVGDAVDRSWLGRSVMTSVTNGAFAERVVAPLTAIRAVPDGLTMTQAAAFWVTYATAYHALVTIGQGRAGDWVVVLGAAGGVGLASVDIASRLGMRVIAAASTRDRVAEARRRGAEAGIAYGHESLKERIKAITGSGADIVVDPVGGAYSEPALRAVRWSGRFLTVGYATGEIPRIPLNLVLLKGVIVRGFELRNIESFVPGATAAAQHGLAELVSRGMRPHIGRVYGLAEAASAMRDIAERRVTGKVVIQMPGT